MGTRTWIGALIATASLAAALVLPSGTAAAETTPTSPRSYESAGPYDVVVTPGASDHTIYYPAGLPGELPVVIWGNGTGASVSLYDGMLRTLASWGFVVAAANTPNAGTGTQMLDGARWLIAEDQRPGSIFYGHIDETEVGATGHSQGGGGAIVAAADPLVTAVVPIMPGPQGSDAAIRGPALYIAGQSDYVVPSWYVRSRFSKATQVPAAFAELRGASHFVPNTAGTPRLRLTGALVSWFRFWLSDDEAARSVFFGSPTGLGSDTAWSRYERNARATAIPG